MAVNFGQRASEAKRASPGYEYSLSALESAWSHVASTKENLDSVGKRIENARNFDINDPNGEHRRNRMVRKYGKRKPGKVLIDPHPEIRYKNSDDVYSDDDIKIDEKRTNTIESHAKTQPIQNQYVPKRIPLYEERDLLGLGDNIAHDFDYDMDDPLVHQRPVTPKVPRLSTSGSGRALFSNVKDSGALERLKERIRQQKESQKSPDQHSFPKKLRHEEDDPVLTNEVQIREPMKRKIAASSSAPTYKGFNLPEAKENVAQTSKVAGIQSKKLWAHQERKERVGKIQHKSGLPSAAQNQKKGQKKTVQKSPGKMQRIISQRKPVASITTTSWRVGQEAVKKVLEAMKEDKASKTKGRSDTGGQRREEASKPDVVAVASDKESYSGREGETETASKNSETASAQQRSDELKTDSARSQDTFKGSSSPERDTQNSKEKDFNDDDDDDDDDDDIHSISKDLSRNEELPAEAKSMLAELQMDPSDEEAIPEKDDMIPTRDFQPSKSPKLKRTAKRKAPSLKQKNEEEKTSKPKIRHYDQEEVQSYMAKQLAERKKKKLEEKKRQQQMKLEQENKLKELYLKQKTSLRSSLAVRTKKIMGSTFTKQIDDRSKSSKERLQPETAMNQFKPTLESFSKESSERSEAPKMIRTPSSQQMDEGIKISYDELNQSTRSENETQFKDSLEVDNDDEQLFGIKGISINKVERTPTMPPRTSTSEQQQRIEAAKSVEEEVRELLAKYKASKPAETRPASSAKVEITDPLKQSKADRIAAISATASSLRERLAAEANRLSSLRMIANREKPPASVPAALSSFASTSEFRGFLPGVHNLDEHAKTNQELLEKEEAATKIQAAYRGHSIRQGLTWKLPSGKSFGAAITEARQKSQETKTYREQFAAKTKPISLSSYSSAFEADSDVSLFSNRTSTASLISEARKAATPKGKAAARPKFKSLQQSQAKGNKRDEDDSLRAILNRSQGNKGDKYSIINIFTRRLKDANKQELDEERAKLAKLKSKEEKHTKHDDLYEQDFEEAEYDTSTSTIKSDLLDEDGKGTASKHSLAQSHSVSKALTTDVSSKAESDEEDPDKTLTLLPDELPEDYSSVKVRSYHSDRDDTLHSTSDVISPPKSPASLTEGSFDYEKDPVMSSTMKNQPISHSERMALNEQDSSLTNTNTVTDKFSPSTLERKLRAEVNQLETMDNALRQVTDIERVRGVSMAQQETVSLAQILKARQLGYRQELEKLSNDAREKATRNANEVERAREAALKIEENATKVLAEIRTEASDAISESRKRLEEAERNAARKVEEAADKVEKANKMTTDVAIESANRYSNDIQAITANAASAAASSAVQAAMQIHREQLEQLRNEALEKVSRSYSQSTFSTTSTRSSSGDRTLTNSVADTDKSKSDDHSYADDDFEELSPEKGSITEEINSAKDESRSSFRQTSKTSARPSSKTTTTQSQDSIIKESISESIGEELDESKTSVHSRSRSRIDDETVDKHSTPVAVGDGKRLKGSIEDLLQQSYIEEQSFKTDDHLASSLTEDEIDDGFRNLLPVISHRRKSLDRDRRARREKLLSDNGTSSDDMKLTPRSVSKHGAQSPFASEDTFTQFTADMVKQYIQEEELRSKHQTALLKLREKALIEKARAEMAYLEMQKTSLKNKKADDLMPPLNKKQRGLWMKLQSEQNEIRRLKQAYKAASHERRFMLYQQKEIMRLKEETQKIWGKLGHDKAAKKEEKPKGVEEDENMDKSVSEASSIASADHSSVISEEITNKSSHIPSILSQSRRTQSLSKLKSSVTSKIALSKKDSISSDSTAEVPEEIPSEQQQSPDSNQASFPTYGSVSKSTKSSSGTLDSKLPDSKLEERDETESTADDISMTEHTQSSMVVDLKRLKKKASEDYLMKRERVLKDRRHQFESVLKNQKEMSDWQKRIELDERRLKSDIKRALDNTKRQAAKPSTSSSKASTEEASESSESTIKSQANSASRTSSTKSILSKDKSSGSDTSMPEEIKTASIETDIPEESNASGSPVINSGSPGIISGSSSIATAYSTPQKKSDSSIAEEYADDTFESPSATRSQTKKSPPLSESVVASASVSPSKRRYSKDSDESKSEEEISIADATSDASDVEKRIRQLEDELRKRRRDLDRIRKKRDKDQLRKKEQRLKQELQAVESLIQQENKENVNHDKSSSESNSFIKGSVSPKIMSPKILQQASPHDQATNKRPKEVVSKASTEVKKSEQGQTAEIKGNSELAKNIANAVIAQVKEKIERKEQDIEDLKERSLSEEISALRKISESARTSKSRESEAKTQEAGAKSHDQVGSVEKDESKSDSLRSIQSLSKHKSISESRRSSEDSKRKSKSVSSESDRSESISEVASRSYKSSSTSSRPSRSILEELSKAKSSVSAKDDDRFVTEEYSQGDRSDSLHSISESIFSEKSTISEKSIEEEVKSRKSGSRSVNETSDQKSERASNVDEIYKDDFFESSSSVRSVREKDAVSQKSTSKVEEEFRERSDRSIRDEAPASLKEKSTKSDSITIKSHSFSSEVSRSIAERFERERSSIALSQYEGFNINDRVIVDGTLRGTIRFIGKASFSPVAVAGVELDVPVGNTDGSFRGKRYFECAVDYGFFSPIASLVHLGVREERGARMGGSDKGHFMGVSDKDERSVDDVDDIVSEQIQESIKSDIQDEISERFLKSEDEKSQRFDLKSTSASLKDVSDREQSGFARLIPGKSQGDEISSKVSIREEILSSKASRKDGISYNDDFEEEGTAATDREASYEDDFEDIDTRQEKSSMSAKPSSKELREKESSVESISEPLSIHTEISEDIAPSKDEKPSEHDQLVAVSKDIVQPSSPLSLSELDSSDAEVIPHPPRVDLDHLADSLTESLLKKLLAESVDMTAGLIENREDEAGDKKSQDVSISEKDKSVSPRSKSVGSDEDKKSVKQSVSVEDISEEIIEHISEKSDDTIKRMSRRAVPDDYDFEISEAFVTPTRSDVTIPNEVESVSPVLERDTEMLERLRNDQNLRPGLVEEVMNRDDDDFDDNDMALKLSPSADHIAEREIKNVAQSLILEAISQMTQIMKDKREKLSKDEISMAEKLPEKLPENEPRMDGNLSKRESKKDEKSFAEYVLSREELNQEETISNDKPSSVVKSNDKQDKLEHLKDIPAIPSPKSDGLKTDFLPRVNKDLPASPPESRSPPDLGLDKHKSAIDTDLLAAKLSELKRMDQEIDDLLGEDSDEDEPFTTPIRNRNILQLDSDETDLIPPVRDFDFGEPVIYVPHTPAEVRNLVAESAKVVLTRLTNGESYDDIIPEESLLRSQLGTVDGDFETSSKMLYKKMVFDVTRDLLKEAKEFKDFQTIAKQPWTRPTRRVFAKFIRQIHNLTGDELIESFQEHMCMCLGLKEGRPSLDELKKRLPLNTSKKDYIDAILVEELREEEPQWVNYDEDETRVKDQLTEGILESLITDTVLVLNDIQTKRTL